MCNKFTTKYNNTLSLVWIYTNYDVLNKQINMEFKLLKKFQIIK